MVKSPPKKVVPKFASRAIPQLVVQTSGLSSTHSDEACEDGPPLLELYVTVMVNACCVVTSVSVMTQVFAAAPCTTLADMMSPGETVNPLIATDEAGISSYHAE